jgi:periplasmic protein TonB
LGEGYRKVNFFLWLLLQTVPSPTENFYVTRLRAGESRMRAGRPAEAAVELTIAGFGLLDRPALLCESLAVRALAEEASGQGEAARAVLERLALIRRDNPACRQAAIDGAWGADLAALARRRLPGVAFDQEAPPRTATVPTASPPPPPATPPPALLPPAPPPATPLPAPTPTVARTVERPAPTPGESGAIRPTAPLPATPTPAPRSSAPEATPVPEEDLDRQPQIQKTTRPIYPPRAAEKRIGGIVLVRVLVSPAGEPLRAEIARGVDRDLDEAAVAAVRLWRFEPGQKGGVAVLAWTTVAVPFEPSRR